MANPSPGTVTTNLQALTGNFVEIFFGNQKIGYLDSIAGNDDFGIQDLSGIGDGHPQENYPTKASHTIQAARAVMRKSSLMAILGKSAGSGGNPFINMDGALQGQVFDVAITQKDSGGQQGKVLRVWRRCTIGSLGVQVNKHTLIMNNVTLHALDVDEDLSGTGFAGLTDMDAN